MPADLVIDIANTADASAVLARYDEPEITVWVILVTDPDGLVIGGTSIHWFESEARGAWTRTLDALGVAA